MAPRGGGGVIEWTPANVVTTVRICLIPLFVVLLLAPWTSWIDGTDLAANVQAFCAMAAFALIALTDSLDGYLARSRNEITVFGKFMDPIADKVLVIAALIALVELGSLPSWVPIVIIARELLVSGLRMLVASAGVVVAANVIGKAKTLVTMVAICLFIIKDAPALSGAQPWFDYVAWALMIAAVVLTVVSMVDYFVKSWALLTSGTAPAKENRAERGEVAPTGQDSPAPKAQTACARPTLEGDHRAAATRVLGAARDRGVTVGTAESCTGGLVAGALTSVPGSSAFVAGGVVSYQPRVKVGVLGVDAAVIDSCGVVSSETASAMADGARLKLAVDFALSTTGVAGPGAGPKDPPVGTVWFGVSDPHGTVTECALFPGSREEVRAQATEHALALLARTIEKDA